MYFNPPTDSDDPAERNLDAARADQNPDAVGTVVFRSLAPVAMAVVWFASMIGIVTGSLFLPQLIGEQGLFLQVSGTAITLVVVGSLLTWVRRLSTPRLYITMRAFAILDVMIFMALILLAPEASGLFIVVLIGQTIFASHVLRLRDLRWVLALATVTALMPVIVNAINHTEYELGARLVALIPMMWLLSMMTFAQSNARISAIRRSKQQALSDSLTGLASRRGLREAGNRLLAADSELVGLLMIDLDNFKIANTLYGHRGGDYVLREVSTALQKASSKHHVLARVGGDEFVVLIPALRAGDIVHHAARYRNAVRSVQASLALKGVSLDASVGCAVSPDDGHQLDDLMVAADLAMYAVKAERIKEVVPPVRSLVDGGKPDAESMAVLDAAETPASGDEDATDSQIRILSEPETAILASIAVLASLIVPDAQRDHLSLALILAVSMLAVSVVAYLRPLELQPRGRLAVDAAIYLFIGVLAFATGGTAGSAWPLVLLLIAYDGWRVRVKGMYLRLIWAELIVFSPLLYQHTGSEVKLQAMIGLITAGAVQVALIGALMANNRVFTAGIRARSRRMAELDSLTDVLNRRAFKKAVDDALVNEEPLALVMIDLDNFKNVNTEHGHQAGDVVLRTVGSALRDTVREGDIVGRVGGDEFAALLIGAGAAEAQRVADRFVNVIDEAGMNSHIAAAHNVTASCGVALYPTHGDTFESLLAAADAALMSVKSGGKASARLHLAS